MAAYATVPNRLSRWASIVFPLLLLAGTFSIYRLAQCIDGCGPYHNRTSVADLDGDGDLDVVVSNLRHEGEHGFWAGPTLWINQGARQFSPSRLDFGGSETLAGDLDGDGDSDLVQFEATQATLFLNQGGAQEGAPGEFRRWTSIAPRAHNGSTRGSLALGDLDGDGRLDVLGGYCCSLLDDKPLGEGNPLPFSPWVWTNATDTRGRLAGHSQELTTLGELPMRPLLGDLDGDGDLDLFAAVLPAQGSDFNTADRVLWNDGQGGFVDSGQRLENPSRTGAGASAGAALGDLDGDGDLDLLVGKAAGAQVWVNQGGAQGGQPGIFNRLGGRLGRGAVEALFLADLDGDGDLDALLAGKTQAAVWWNDGNAGFKDSGQRLRYTERHGLALDNFNADGCPDVLAVAYDQDFRLWLNQCNGLFLQDD